MARNKRVVRDPAWHKCATPRLGFKPMGILWDCAECGTVWRKEPDNNYAGCGSEWNIYTHPIKNEMSN